MIKEPISLTQMAFDDLGASAPAPKLRRQPNELRAQPRNLSHPTTTAVLLPFPTATPRIGRRGTISDVAPPYAGKCGPVSHEDIDQWKTAGLAVIDYAILGFVLTSVAFGPMLVWVLLWAAG
jgi:hypothetical protein